MINTAFVSSFSGANVSTASSLAGQAVTCRRQEASRRPVVQARYFLEKYKDMAREQSGRSNFGESSYYLEKYDEMSGAHDSITTPDTTGPSAYWSSFQDLLRSKLSDYHDAEKEQTLDDIRSAQIALTMPFMRERIKVFSKVFGKGGDPDSMLITPPMRKGDSYMAECIKKQYKMTAAPFGIFNVQCTEGTVRGQAEESRNLALSASFRMKQRTTSQKFADFCETRRKAIIGAHGCDYEEKLLDSFPVAARAYVTASSESRGSCVRSAVGSSPAEAYMSSCVDKQMKFRAVPYGVYDILCSDGNASDVAEYKRVQALSAKFRASQMPDIAKAQAKYDNAAYARDFYGHGCDYEEDIFNQYPAVSASMRPTTARY